MNVIRSILRTVWKTILGLLIAAIVIIVIAVIIQQTGFLSSIFPGLFNLSNSIVAFVNRLFNSMALWFK